MAGCCYPVDCRLTVSVAPSAAYAREPMPTRAPEMSRMDVGAFLRINPLPRIILYA